MNEELRIIISGGGTGGHIFPAVSIANAIRTKYPKAKNIILLAQKEEWKCNVFLLQAMK